MKHTPFPLNSRKVVLRRLSPRYLLPLLLSCLFFFSAFAQPTAIRDELLASPGKTGGVYSLYPVPEKSLTPAPPGYRPVYISHYGRHGSRWLLRDSDYTVLRNLFAGAAREEKLTPLGITVGRRLQMIADDASKREGELAPLGTAQHRDIAERMFRTYPEVFAGDARVTCRSTMVVRCVMSMAAFAERLKELNPRLRLTRDASKRFAYLNYTSPEAARFYDEPGWNATCRKFREQQIRPRRLVAALFADEAYLNERIEPIAFMEKLFLIASDLQNLEIRQSLYELFEPEELYRLWQAVNFEYYIRRGPSPLNRGLAAANAQPLTERIVADADRALAGAGPAADLRFGHDGGLMSLLARMQVAGCCATETDPEKVGAQWADFRIAPMAANLQIVFYRPVATGEILVKFLHNEREVLLALPTATPPYYAWPAVRRFLLADPGDSSCAFIP